MLRKFSILLMAFSLLLSGCTLPLISEPTATATSVPPTGTATLTSTLQPTSTYTPEPPTATPTIAVTLQPMAATIKTGTNVRSLPSKGRGERIGGVYANATVQVVARDETATWLWILFSDSPNGKGWITAGAVTLSGDMGILPIALYEKNAVEPILLPALLYSISGTPLPISAPVAGSVTARANQLLNVRVGPSVGYVVIGMIQPGTQVTLTGKTATKWYQIEYPSGIGGRAWISGAILKINGDVKTLPTFNLMGTPEAEKQERPNVDKMLTATALAGGGAVNETPSAPATVLSTATNDPASTPTPRGPMGTITTQINVRSGPSQSFQSYGLIDPNTSVIITGRTLNGLWLLIEYAGSPTGFGWVAADYVKIQSDISSLPYYDNNGTPAP